jgi:NADPH:quinone reductase-like Zn-dependent oxidoreductase
VRAVVLHAPGGPGRLEVTELPDPGRPGPGEVRVRLYASSLNYTDHGIVMGGLPAPDGHIPLADAAGVVEAVGPGVDDLVPGDDVIPYFFPHWESGPATKAGLSGAAGIGTHGYARQVVVKPASWFTRMPRNLSHEEAATLPVAGLTAWRAVTEAALGPGAAVVVLGTGGVSLFALQFAKAAGATVIATSSSNDKLAHARRLGADHVINYRTTPAWGQVVRDLTNGHGADQVVEVGGPGTLEQSIDAIRVGGHISLIGVLTGGAGTVPTSELMYKQARLQGVVVGNRSQQRAMVHAVETLDLHPVLDRSFDLEELAEACAFHGTGQHVGKIGIRIRRGP